MPALLLDSSVRMRSPVCVLAQALQVLNIPMLGRDIYRQ